VAALLRLRGLAVYEGLPADLSVSKIKKGVRRGRVRGSKKPKERKNGGRSD